jgi:hypothetical protein
MARFPGTEVPTNKDGWKPGDAARGRRSRAAGAQGLADRRGVVVQVRPAHVRLVVEPGSGGLWTANELLLPCDGTGDAELELLRALLRHLGGQRLEYEAGDLLTIYCGELSIKVLDAVRALLGERLAALELAPEGVHELAVRLHLRPA